MALSGDHFTSVIEGFLPRTGMHLLRRSPCCRCFAAFSFTVRHPTSPWRPFVALAGVLLLFGGGPLGANGPEDPILQGRRSLEKQGKLPWYDADSDLVRRIDLEQQPRRNHSSHISLLGRLLRPVAWGVLAAFFIVIVVLLVRYLFDKDLWKSATVQDFEEKNVHQPIVEKLPVTMDSPTTDFLAEASRLYQAGSYGNAIVYLFCYQLVALDRGHLIRLARGKTNRQYLHEIRSSRPLYDLVERTMVAFEDAFFGQHAIDRRRFESCWNRLSEFDNLVHQAEPGRTMVTSHDEVAVS